MSAIRAARRRSGLTVAEVSSAVGRDATWLSLAENGVVPIPADHAQKMLAAINRLERFAQTVATAREKLTSDLRLPPRTSGRPHLHGE